MLPKAADCRAVMSDDVQHRTVAGVDVWRPFRGPFERWPQLTDLLVALLAFVLTLLMWSKASDQPPWSMGSLTEVGAFLCAFVACFALLWRRSHPLQVHAVVLGASILVFIGPTPDGIVALSFSLYSLGRYEANGRASLAGALAALIFIIIDLEVFAGTPSAGQTIAAAMVMVLWYIGRRLRFRGEYLRLLEERALHLERERDADAERAVVAERTRIAREMHDVVAHQVSLMTVQAGAARTVVGTDPGAASDAIRAVEDAGRHALSEMRHLLDVLRPVAADDALGPQPGMADLPALVRKVSDVGPVVRLETRGELTGLPARLELNAYRIVQEALTNVIKHAGTGVNVDVAVDGLDDRVVISIADDGKGGEVGKARGHGIAGMRERVELLGGVFSAGAGTRGGFEIRAVLPLASGAT